MLEITLGLLATKTIITCILCGTTTLTVCKPECLQGLFNRCPDLSITLSNRKYNEVPLLTVIQTDFLDLGFHHFQQIILTFNGEIGQPGSRSSIYRSDEAHCYYFEPKNCPVPYIVSHLMLE